MTAGTVTRYAGPVMSVSVHRPVRVQPIGPAKAPISRVKADQPPSGVEGVWMQRGFGQRYERGFQDGGKDFSRHGKAAFARRGFTDLLAREFCQVRSKRSPLLADVVDQPGEQLARTQPRGTPLARTMLREDGFQSCRWQHPLKVGKECVFIAYPHPPQPLRNPLSNQLPDGIGVSPTYHTQKMTLYLLRIGEGIHGPYTAHQVVAYYDAGEIDDATQIVRAPADAKVFDSAVCRTIQTSGLFKSFPELRATSDNPSVYYLGQILEQQNQSIQINQRQLYWIRVVGVIVAVSWILTQIYSCSQHS